MIDFEQMQRAIAHDPCRAGDRAPLGALPAKSVVDIRLRVREEARSFVDSATLLVGSHDKGDSGFSWFEHMLVQCDDGYAVSFALAQEPQVVFYAFRLELCDQTQVYYVPNLQGTSTAGQLVKPGVDGEWTASGWSYVCEDQNAAPSAEQLATARGFQITIYNPDFTTPSWMNGAVMYQIFPDRFSRGSRGPREEGLRYHAAKSRPVHLHKQWNEPVDWGAKDYDPIDFFGGTLDGIREKLDYLASLGVEVLYMNPIFEARSNHRYDTADYEHIDALLGSDDDFAKLAESARERGIHLVLDAVLSHTGNDSRYFNGKGTYDGPGALQGETSPYYRWFDFNDEAYESGYRCWWGDPTLPEVNECEPSWQDYILGEQGILARWLSAGASGYRLDVADEIPDEVLEALRRRVRATQGDAGIIGEVWEDATTKESYGVPRTYALGEALDSVMNYPLRTALLDFALGVQDARQLATFLKLQKSNYPPPMHACLMNLLSSHDIERVRSVLALGGPFKQLTRKEQLDLVESTTDEQDAMGTRLQRLVAALLYALPGMPCIYYGDEYGMSGGGDPFCRATFPQSEEEAARRDDCGQSLLAFYRQLGKLRKGSTALRSGELACTAPTPDVLCLVRATADGEGAFVVAANRSTEPCTVAFDVESPDFGLSPQARQAFRTNVSDLPSVLICADPTDAPSPAPYTLQCEGGIVRLSLPAHAALYWDVPLGSGQMAH